MYARLACVVLTMFLCVVPSFATSVEVTVRDATGNPLKNALVILQELTAQQHELCRTLTNDQGKADLPSLNQGLYRIISVYPYSRWRASVREFLVLDQPVTLDIRMAETEGYDDLPVSIGDLKVHVVAPDGRSAQGARVLVRDAEADPHSESSGITDAEGDVTLHLTKPPDVLLVVYQNHLYSFPANGLDTERVVRLK